MNSIEIRTERTVVLIKPDAVKRALIGEILHRFEKAGLKIVALKMTQPTADFASGHYSGSEEWLSGMGKKTLDSFREHGLDVDAVMGTSDAYAIGKMVQGWLVGYLSEGPIVSAVLEGVHAISTVRKLIGFTIPAKAQPGTIRGDLAIDSNTVANIEKRSTKNLVHASGDPSEAKHEIAYWFRSDEIVKYVRCDEGVMF